MTKSFRKVLMALFMLVAISASAQMIPQLSDPQARTGKLPNGLSYYIRHNEFPKGQADFHIAQKVGAVQENEEQNGLAHFLEHMCFNGTKNFPDKKLLTWLESIGVKFGYNLNAHTGTDETVYDITNVPVARESVVDSCLLILHDWADALTLADEEINKERGVIHEEWRMGYGAISRILRRHAPELYPNTPYATHDVIGSMDVIDNFAPQVLRDYYEKWYRPDLQGIIVVGDIDVDQVEKKIVNLFAPIKMPQNPAEFTYTQVADNAEPIVISDKDAEMPANILFIAQKYDFLPREMRNTDAGLMMEYMNAVVQSVMNERFTDITLKPNAPFAGCNLGMDSYLYASTKGAALIQAYVNDKGAEAALNAVLTEVKRAKDFGFTQSEFERARDEYLSLLEKAYNNRTSDKNDVYAQRYIRNFIQASPVAPIEYEYEKMKAVIPMLPLEAVNQYVSEVLSADPQNPKGPLGKNLVVMAMTPEKEGIVVPTVEQLNAVIAAVNAATIEAPKDDAVKEPLMSELPKPGKIVKTETNDVLGFTTLTLSNGVKVALKPTDFKENEIVLKAVSDGGASLYPAADYANTILATDMIGSTGLGKFSTTQLSKVLAGKQASISMSITGYDESVNGKSTSKDLETMMQLLYLNFTQPRENEEEWNNIKNLYSSQLENYGRNPQVAFSDSLNRNLYSFHPKAMIESKEMIDQTSFKRMLEIYKERFGNAADFNFVIVGSFDMEQMKQYVAQYIGSLPANKNAKKETAANDGKQMAKGKVEKRIVIPSESKQAMLALIWSANIKYNLENRLMTSVAGQLMANELLNSVREDEGAAYSPYASGSMRHNYADMALIQTVFGLNPDKNEKSIALSINSLEKLAKNIPTEELNKIKEFMLKKADEDARENSYWANTIAEYAAEGIDLHSSFKQAVSSLTTKQMQQFIAQLIGQGNRFQFLMMPE